MKPVAAAKKPSSGSNLTYGIAPSQTGCTTKSNMFFSSLPAACWAFMIYSSVTAIVDSHGDPFTAFAFFVVSSLCLDMRDLEKAVAVKDDLKTAKILFSYRVTSFLNCPFMTGVTSVLQSPVMIGVIWGIAAVTSLPLAESIQLPIEASSGTDIHPQLLSSPFIALVVSLVIVSLFFILALVYMIKKLETNPNFFVKDPFKLQVAKSFLTVFLSVTFGCLCSTSTGDGSEISSSSSLYRDILNVFFLCGCSVSILRVSSLATLEFKRAVITKNLLRSNFLKITISSLLMLLTSLCTYRASSVLQVGVMTAGAWAIAVLSWSVSTHNNQPGELAKSPR